MPAPYITTAQESKDTQRKKKPFLPIDNYIYLYHTNDLLILPGYPDAITDNTPVSYAQSTSLGRSAPIWSYTGSGPRSLQVSLKIHREAMNQMNYNFSNSSLAPYLDPEDDYVDALIKRLQAAALPTYAASQKMVDPPLVACRFGNDIYIKGIISGSVGVTYQFPILKNGKLAQCEISFGVAEVDAYDAMMVREIGSFRDPGDITINTNGDHEVYMSMAGMGLRKDKFITRTTH